MGKKHTFKAKLEAGNGCGAFVRVPFDVEKAFGKKRVPIVATIDGESYRGTLVRMGTPGHCLGVLKAIRKQIVKADDGSPEYRDIARLASDRA